MFSFKSKLLSSFAALNITQFTTALNDNFFKLLLIFFLISVLGHESSNTILSIAGAVFVIPFLLLASFAGSLADRYSKRSIIYFTRLIELFTTSMGVLAFYFQSIVGGYAVLFGMAVLSAIFSPCKYGIIPEIVQKNRISSCNGIMGATTYLAIILGTFLASFLSQLTHKNFVLSSLLCLFIAVIGALFSLGIEKTAPQSQQTKISTRFITDIYLTLKKAHAIRYLLITLVFGSYFLFMGAYTQLNIIPFTLQALGLSEIQGGYLFLMTALGIGIGSFLAGKLSGQEVELGFIPLAILGITCCFMGLYMFSSHFYIVIILLILLGVCGGFYILPVEAYIQLASPDGDRGKNVAANNFLGFLGVIVASGLIALLGNGFHLSAAEGFLVVGIVSGIMGLFLSLIYADQLLRLFVATTGKLFFRIRVVGKQRLYLKEPVLLVAPRLSWLDTLIVMATLPRMIRYIVPTIGTFKRRSLFYKLLCLIPIDIQHFSPIGPPALASIKKELGAGQSVCLMHPVNVSEKTLKEWEHKLSELLKDIHVPIMPVHILRGSSEISSYWGQLKEARHRIIKVSYGPVR